MSEVMVPPLVRAWQGQIAGRKLVVASGGSRGIAAMRLSRFVFAACVALFGPAAIAAPAVPKHASTISGTVTRTADASVVAGATILVADASGGIVTFATTGAAGTYTVDPGPGTFAIAVLAPRLVTEVYDDLPCPNFSCDLGQATPIVLAHGAAITGIDFALDPQPRITGTVTGGSPAVPRAGVDVTAFLANGDGVAGSGTTLADGSYELFFDPGTVNVRTSNTAQLIDEVHPDIACAFGICDTTGASVFTLTTGQSQAGVDFVLAQGASLGGEVTRESDGQPLEGLPVLVYDATGANVTATNTAADGSWRVGTGMPAGTYRAVVLGGGSFQPELWDDIECTGPAGDECQVADGDPIVLAGTQVRTDIDFALRRSAAVLSGTITRFDTGAPLAGVFVQVYSGANLVIEFPNNADGTWSIEVPPGNYTVRASPLPPFAPELYPGVQCLDGFFFCAGTAETIALAPEQEIGDIDFALAPVATLSVVARNGSTGAEIGADWLAALPGVETRVQRFSQPGSPAVYEVFNGGDVRVAGRSAACGPLSDQVCLGERFPNDPCPGLACDLSIGTAITVPKGATVAGIELSLDVGATIAGTLTEAAGGAPIGSAVVDVLDVNRVPIGSTLSEGDGTYAVRGLGFGPYYVFAEPPSPLLAELFNDVACPNRACVLASGTTIATTPGATTPGVDFAFAAGGTIAGTVTRDSSGALEGATITIFNAVGEQVAETTSDFNGAYVSAGLPAGSYFVRFTKPGFGGILYSNLPCPPATCNPTAGTAVVVAAGQPTTGIDAVLPDTGQPGPAQLVFLNRCAPIGCVVHGGNESAINNTSSIVTGTRNLSPYAWGDASFAALAQCVRETFAPYQVTITTTDPGNVPHREHMVAGTPAEAGFSNGVAGVSPFTCGSIPNSISFTFANVIGDDIHELCWTAAQEIAHGFGLDHEVNPPDAMSYIDAPTTKRFTPDTVACGEFSPRACACGGNTQNSNALLLRAVGGNPNLFANGFEDAAATANDAWKSYRSPFPKLMHAEPLSCGVDPVLEVAKRRNPE